MTDSVGDIFSDIVGKVNTVLMPALSQLMTNDDTPVNRGIVNINYDFGPYKSIVKKLTQWTASETYEPKRYPLVALIQPFNEGKGQQIGVTGVDNIDIAICMRSEPSWETDTRYTINFKPILIPIYNELLNQISLDKRIFVQSVNLIQHTKIEWPFWDAGQDKNPFNDVLDVVEIKNMKLKFLNKNSNC